MIVGLVTYAANLLRPWLGMISAAAVAFFLAFLLLHAWVGKRPFYVGKSVPEGSAPRRGARFRRTAAARTANGFVGLVDLISLIFRRISFTAAFLAVVGFAAVALTTPATAGAGSQLLGQAQQALKKSLPAQFTQVADLSSPKVSKEGSATVYTFTVPAKAGAKKSSAKTYTVTIGPGGTVTVAGWK